MHDEIGNNVFVTVAVKLMIKVQLQQSPSDSVSSSMDGIEAIDEGV